MADNPSPIILQTGKNPQHSIIWLHGLGADGQDFVPIADELELPVAVRYIFPHAPLRPVTINGGFVMRAWYDIAGQSMDAQQDAAGIRASQSLVEAAHRPGSGARHRAAQNISGRIFPGRGHRAAHRICVRLSRWAACWRCRLICRWRKARRARCWNRARQHPFSWRTDAAIPSYPMHWELLQGMRCWDSAMQWNGMNTPCNIRCARRNCVISELADTTNKGLSCEDCEA